MTLTERIMRHPINDDAYLRHLRTADVFNELQEARKILRAREAWRDHYEEKVSEAKKAVEALKAKAALMQSMEDL